MILLSQCKGILNVNKQLKAAYVAAREHRKQRQGQNTVGLLDRVASENIHDFGNEGREIPDFLRIIIM
jgi:hypothetical protein